MRRITSAFFAVLFVLLFSGCSVYMAARQPDKKDLSVLSPGTTRARVIAELGEPVKSCTEMGELTDTLLFRQGYSKGARVGRGLLHATADVLTIGLWEALGTPIELIADGDEVQVDVRYDQDEQVRSIHVTKGADVVKEVSSAATLRYATPLSVIMAEAQSLPSPAIGLAPGLVLQDAHLVPKTGITVGDPAEVISPDIRLQWLSKTTGVGDWFTNPRARGTYYPSTRSSSSGQSASTPAKSEPITSYCGPLEVVCTGVLMLTFETVRDIGTGLYAMAYTIYLPFATATGAVAGEIDAQRWNFCKDDFMQKVREANPANEIIDTVVKASPGLLVLTKDDAFEKAKELGLSKLVTVMINGVGLKTCFDLGVFSLAVDATASVYDVATKEKLFSENYTPRSSQCLKADSYCSEKGTTFTQKEINRLAVEIAGHIRSLIENRL